MSQNKGLLQLGLFFMASAIILGALGAHALQNMLSEKALQSFKTGVLYQMIGALGILLAFGIQHYFYPKSFLWFLRLQVLGIFFFSWSIYALSFKEVLLWEWLKFLGPITPLGGLLMIASWILLIFSIKSKE